MQLIEIEFSCKDIELIMLNRIKYKYQIFHLWFGNIHIYLSIPNFKGQFSSYKIENSNSTFHAPVHYVHCDDNLVETVPHLRTEDEIILNIKFVFVFV